MSNNKQSSVDWLQTQLKKGIDFNPLDPLSYPKAVDNLFNQAKAMHKEEIVQTYDDGIMKGRHEDGIEYYTYIFGGNNDQQ